MGGRGSGTGRAGIGAPGVTTISESSKPSYLRETEKAVMLTMQISGEVAPQGGFVSSMVRDFNATQDVWIPKSQLDEQGRPSAWILEQKANEITDRRMPMNGRMLNSNVRVLDANKNVVPTGMTAKDREFAARRQAQQASFETKKQAGLDRYTAKINKAKELGIKGVRIRMKTSTLNELLKEHGYDPSKF